MNKIDYLIGVDVIASLEKEQVIESYTLSCINLDTGEFEETLLKKYNREKMIQDVNSFIENYPNCKIMFENNNLLLGRFLECYFEDYLYESEATMFGRKYKGFRLTPEKLNSFDKTREGTELNHISSTLKYFYYKTLGQ